MRCREVVSAWYKKHQFLNFSCKTIWGNYGKRVKLKGERKVSNRWNYIHKRGVKVNGWESRALNFKTFTLNNQIRTLRNNFVIVLVCAKCSKLITLEENMISVQQVPLCLPLFFAFSSEVLNSGVKSYFDGVVFQDLVCEECFSTRLWCLRL